MFTRTSSVVLTTAVVATGIATNATAQANYYESGNWATVRMGQNCHVYSLRADKHTSGVLSFTFADQGYNASFTYEYHPWTNDEGAPWDQNADYVELYIDDTAIWLGDEMFFGVRDGVDNASMASGLVGEMIDATLTAQRGVSFAVHRTSEGETWTYGGFSTLGFADVIRQAGQTCGFDPRNLPSS